MQEGYAWYAITGVTLQTSLPAVQRKNDSHDLFRATRGMSFLFPFIEEAECRIEVVQHSSF